MVYGEGGYRLPVVETTGCIMSPFQGYNQNFWDGSKLVDTLGA